MTSAACPPALKLQTLFRGPFLAAPSYLSPFKDINSNFAFLGPNVARKTPSTVHPPCPLAVPLLRSASHLFENWEGMFGVETPNTSNSLWGEKISFATRPPNDCYCCFLNFNSHFLVVTRRTPTPSVRNTAFWNTHCGLSPDLYLFFISPASYPSSVRRRAPFRTVKPRFFLINLAPPPPGPLRSRS